MRVLIGCATSDIGRAAFERLGHDAWSCDLLPTRGNTKKHFQCDVRDVLHKDWDLFIFHPDCTYLTISAAWAFGDGPYHQKVKPGTLVGAARRKARDEAVKFAAELMSADIPRKAMENPVGFLSSMYRKPDQTIQPYQFGDDASKATCLYGLKDCRYWFRPSVAPGVLSRATGVRLSAGQTRPTADRTG